jgi:transposase
MKPVKMDTKRFIRANRVQLRLEQVDYEKLVLPTDPIRYIDKYLDNRELSPFEEQNRSVENEAGRPAYDPKIIIGVLLYGMSEGITELRQLEKACREWAPLRWFCGGIEPSKSTFGEFVKKHKEAIRDLFVQGVEALLDNGIIHVEEIAMDGTRVKTGASKGSFHRGKTILAKKEAAEALVEKSLQEIENAIDEKEEKKLAGQLNRNLKKLENIKAAAVRHEELAKRRREKGKDEKETRASITDPEAGIVKTGDGGFVAGYNICLGVSTDAKPAILALELSRDGSDMRYLDSIVEQTQETTGHQVSRVLVDDGIVSGENLRKMAEKGIEVISPAPGEKSISNSLNEDDGAEKPELQVAEWDEQTKNGQLPKNLFTIQDNNKVFCPAGKEMRPEGKLRQENRRWIQLFRGVGCADCPFKKACSNGKSNRRISVGVDDKYLRDHQEKMKSSEAQERYKKRCQTVELRNAHLKQNYSMRVIRRRGVEMVTAVALLAAICCNASINWGI